MRRGESKTMWLAIAAMVLVAVAAGAAWAGRRAQLSYRLVIAAADSTPRDPQLVRFAHAVAVPAYAKACAGCHGPDMKGDHRAHHPLRSPLRSRQVAQHHRHAGRRAAGGAEQ
jgi:cytochrome c553